MTFREHYNTGFSPLSKHADPLRHACTEPQLVDSDVWALCGVSVRIHVVGSRFDPHHGRACKTCCRLVAESQRAYGLDPLR